MIVGITGGTGFIGRSLVRRFSATGVQVRVLSRRAPHESGLPSEVRVYPADLSQAGGAQLQTFLEGVEVLVHCAGEVRAKERMRALHVSGTHLLLQAAKGKVRRWVQLSSVGTYGPERRRVVHEDTPDAPVGEYETTRMEADRLVRQSAEEGAFEAVVLRPSIVFGPGMPNRSLYQLISLVDRGWFAFVGAVGAMANYVFVDDVADALWMCATSPDARGTYNLSDDRSMEDFIGTIAAALGRPAPTLRLPEGPLRLVARILQRLPGSPLTESRVEALSRRTTYLSTRIQDELEFEFRVSIEQGLRRLVEDWRGRR
jgi:nucleoside-diphosphate-sugar epimerase